MDFAGFVVSRSVAVLLVALNLKMVAGVLGNKILLAERIVASLCRWTIGSRPAMAWFLR
jgi:hypothetical protein